MKILITLPFILLLSACMNTQPHMTELDHDIADCDRLGGRLEIQPRDVYCHLPNGKVLDGLDLILE